MLLNIIYYTNHFMKAWIINKYSINKKNKLIKILIYMFYCKCTENIIYNYVKVIFINFKLCHQTMKNTQAHRHIPKLYFLSILMFIYGIILCVFTTDKEVLMVETTSITSDASDSRFHILCHRHNHLPRYVRPKL